MTLPGIGTWEILLLILIAIILFGPKKIPELAKSIGQAIREFRKASSGAVEEGGERVVKERRVEARKESIEDYEDLIMDVAKKLDVETKDKELKEVLKDILVKAKEKGIYDEAIKKLEKMK